MNSVNFSKGVLKYALDNNINKNDLLENYASLIPDYYQYGNDVMLEREIDYCENEKRDGFFGYNNVKDIFWLIMDWYFVEETSGEGKLSDNRIVDEITEESTGKDIYWFLKNKLKDMDDSFFIGLRNKHNKNDFEPDKFFSEILTTVGVPDKLHETVHKSFNYYSQFYYAEEDYIENNS